MIARRTLQGLLAVGGVAAIGIALLHIALEPSCIPGSIPVNATMDSEDRFYATLFLAYGVALLWCIRAVERKARVVQLLALIFFVGGVARVISMIAVGRPGPFFLAMTALELVVPFVLAGLAARVGRDSG